MSKHIFPDTENEDLFWLFIHHRQLAWHNRKVLHLSQDKWTNDPIIQNARFTNVYRELDRGTQYGICEIAEKQASKSSTTQVDRMIMHLFAYRWFNRISTYEAIKDHIDVLIYSRGVVDYNLEVALREHALKGNKLYTGAYIATYCPNLGAEDGIGNALRVLQNIAKQIPTLKHTIRNGKLQDIVALVQTLPGFGNFMSYQITLDMCYRLVNLDGGAIASNANVNSWVQLGPGAKKGLLLLGVKGSTATLVRAAKELTEDQYNGFNRIGVDFQYVTGKSGIGIPLTLANIEHSLCEFQKYHRMLNGGHVKTIYKNAPDTEWTSKYQSTPWWDGAVKGDKIWQR